MTAEVVFFNDFGEIGVELGGFGIKRGPVWVLVEGEGVDDCWAV